MTADEILKKAKERLAELDTERAELQSIIAAAEGKPIAVPAPNPVPFIPVMPNQVPRLPPFSVEGVSLSSMPADRTWTIHNSSTPVDVIRGFVAGGVCVDTTSLVFRA